MKKILLYIFVLIGVAAQAQLINSGGSVGSISEIRRKATVNKLIVTVAGLGNYRWNPSSSATEDSAINIRVGSGAWEKIIDSGQVNLAWWKLNKDGVTDDGAKINQIFNYASVANTTVTIPGGTYKISNNITIPSSVRLRFLPNAIFSIDAGVTVTANGPIENTDLSTFTSGSGTFSTPTTRNIDASTAASGNLVLRSTTNATKGLIKFGNAGNAYYDEQNGIFGVTRPGTAGQFQKFFSDASGIYSQYVNVSGNPKTATIDYTMGSGTFPSSIGQAVLQMRYGIQGSGLTRAFSYDFVNKRVIFGSGTDNQAAFQIQTGNLSVATVTSTTQTLTLDTSAYNWSYSGAAAGTWTLPVLSGRTGWLYTIFNRSAFPLTINGSLFNGRSVSSIVIQPGQWKTLLNDGGFWVSHQDFNSNIRVTDLATYPMSADSAMIYVSGFYSNNDGGQGFFMHYKNQPNTADSKIVINGPNSDQYKRMVVNGVYTPEMFGAKGDFSTDDQPAFQAANDYLYTVNSPTFRLSPGKRYKLNSTWFIGPVGTSPDPRTTGFLIEGAGMRNNQGSTGGGSAIYTAVASGAAIVYRASVAKSIIMRNFSIESIGTPDTLVEIVDSKHSFLTWDNIDFVGGKVVVAQLQGSGANGEFNHFVRCKFRTYSQIGYYHNASQALHPSLEDCRWEPGSASTCIYFASNPGGIITNPQVTPGNSSAPNIFLRVGGSQYDAINIYSGRIEGMDQLIVFDNNSSAQMVNLYGTTVTLNQNSTTAYNFIDFGGGVGNNNTYAMHVNWWGGKVVVSSLTNKRPLPINAMFARAASFYAEGVEFSQCYPSPSLAIDNTNDYNIFGRENVNRTTIEFNNCTQSYSGSGSSSTSLKDFPFSRKYASAQMGNEKEQFRRGGTAQNYLLQSSFTSSTGSSVAPTTPWTMTGGPFTSANDFTPGNSAGNTISSTGKIVVFPAGSTVYQDVVDFSSDTSQHVYNYKALLSVRDSSVFAIYLTNPTTGYTYDSVTFLGDVPVKSQWARTFINLSCYKPRNETGKLRLVYKSLGGNTVAYYQQGVSEKFDAVFVPTTTATVGDNLVRDVDVQRGRFQQGLQIPVTTSQNSGDATTIGSVSMHPSNLNLGLWDGVKQQNFFRSDLGTAAPTTGTWPLGWYRFNNGTDTTIMFWYCYAAGTPGSWATYYKNSGAGAGGGGAVSSVFGRTGAITAQTGDYTFSQIGSTPTTLTGYGITDAVPSSRTINGKALSSNQTLTLNSSDFANQGTATTVLIGNNAGNPSFGQVNLTSMVTGVLPIANGGAPATFAARTIYGNPSSSTAAPSASTSFDLAGNGTIRGSFTLPGISRTQGTGAITIDTTTGAVTWYPLTAVKSRSYSTVAAMQAESSTSVTFATVNGPSGANTYYYSTASLTPNGVTILTADGKGSGYWVMTNMVSADDSLGGATDRDLFVTPSDLNSSIGTVTLQQAISNGSTLTADNTITNTGKVFQLKNGNRMFYQDDDFQLLSGASSVINSSVYVDDVSASIGARSTLSPTGVYYMLFDTTGIYAHGVKTSTAATNKMAVIDTTTYEVSWQPIPSGGGGGITALTGDVTASGTGSVVATIANDAVTTAKILNANVTNAKLANSSLIVNGTSISLGSSGTVTANTTNALGIDATLAYASGTTFDGSAPRTLGLNLSNANAWSANVAPSAANTYSSGTASNEWSNVYARNLISSTTAKIQSGSTSSAVQVSVGTTLAAQFQGTSRNLLLQNGGTFTDDGMRLQIKGGGISMNVTTSSAASLTLDGTASHWVFTGTTSTWTLPAVAAHTGWTYWVKNRGSGNLTIQRAGSDNIYDNTTQTSITVAAGASIMLVNDGTYWLQE